MKTRILCVCLGNICRSPMAEGALRRRAAETGLEIEVDSAGLGSWHVGNPPDPRGLKAAAARGYDNSAQRCRQVTREDFARFDLILGMDRENVARLRAMAPPGTGAEIALFHPGGTEVPDPYYGGPADYEHALDLIEEGADALIARLGPAGAA